MPPNNKDFKKLQAEWDKKLKDDGFEDAENRDGTLKIWHDLHFRKPSHDTNQRADFEATSEYYRLTSQFLHSHQFSSLSERHIWELHCEGKSVKQFRSEDVKYQQKVYQILNKLIKEMKSKWNQTEK